MEKITSVEQYHELKNEKNIVFLFSAQWCRDCVFINPFMPEVEEKFNQFAFYYVDRDQYIDLCIEEDVFGIPSFVVYSEGEEVDRYVNRDRKTQEQIEAFLSESFVKITA